jgi:hypothetical protein
LHPSCIALGEVRKLILGDHIARIQELQGIGPDKQRRIGMTLHEVDVVHILIDENLHRAQEN